MLKEVFVLFKKLELRNPSHDDKIIHFFNFLLKS